MARKARRDNQSKSGFYHCYSRGNRKQAIFKNDIDYKHFLSLIGEHSGRCKVEIHAFCLMPNHFHLLLRASDVDVMAQFFHRLVGQYTLRTNKIYDEVGHLFQGRYQADPVETDLYVLEASRYIHNNPKDLNLNQPMESYPWSSLAGYIDPKYRNSFLRTEFILGYFPSPSAYLSFVTKEAPSR